MAASRPLEGLLVVSMEQAVAAPYCSSRLADAGANMVSLAASYHAGRFLQPGNPRRRVYFPQDGTVYWRLDPARWAGRRSWVLRWRCSRVARKSRVSIGTSQMAE